MAGITPEAIEKLKDFKDLREFLTSLSIQEIRKGDDQGHFLSIPKGDEQLDSLIDTFEKNFKIKARKRHVFRLK